METLRQQKLDAMKELAYGASHEINNPLANISARAQALLRDEELPERRRALEAIRQQAMRAHEMISDLMLFARPPQLKVEAFDLRQVLEAVAEDLTEECVRRSIRLTVDCPDVAVEIVGDRQQLFVAVKALIDNALEAIGQEGAIEATLNLATSSSETSTVWIEISDTGPGIPEEIREHMFDPFYSGREAGRGLGFGLSKCWRIVTDHGGTVVAESEPEGGAMFRLELPVGGPRDC